jgi:hypothetical protein
MYQILYGNINEPERLQDTGLHYETCVRDVRHKD